MITAKPALTIGRMAGQYGKPRSSPMETVEGWGKIYSYKGENINGYEPKDRKWDPPNRGRAVRRGQDRPGRRGAAAEGTPDRQWRRGPRPRLHRQAREGPRGVAADAPDAAADASARGVRRVE